jgi:hypothetical protein
MRRPWWAKFECPTNARPFSAFDLIAEDIVAQAHVIATPADHPRPGQAAEEGPAGARPFGARDPPSENTCERPQEILEGVAAPRAQDEVQVRPHVGKIVDSHVESTRHAAQHIAHGAVVLAQRPRASGSMARQNHMHRAARADGALELAPPATDVAPVNRPPELDLHLATEKGQLHWVECSHQSPRGNVVPQ